MAKGIGDYRNELGPLYSAIYIITNVSEDIYRQINGLDQEEYLFSNVDFLNSIGERYTISERKDLLRNNNKADLKQINTLTKEINQKLEEKSENVSDLSNKVKEIERIIYSSGNKK